MRGVQWMPARVWATAVWIAAAVLPAQVPSRVPPERPPAPPTTPSRGLPTDPAFFPLGVWLQDPALAVRYRAAGINLFVGLWKGPTEEQLGRLAGAGMRVICAQNAVGLRHLASSSIVGWMHDDEPDNAQRTASGLGPPVAPKDVVARYRVMRAADPSRPVLLQLGQGAAWDGWWGRGSRSGHPEDYPRYLEGCDLASCDIYPVAHRSRIVRDKLWFVAHGVTRMRRFAADRKPVWSCIEAASICAGQPLRPEQLRAEVWMALIHGARGLVYFVHQLEPKVVPAAVLRDPVLLPALTRINARIRSLAPVLHAEAVPDAVKVRSTDRAVPVASVAKRYGGALYVFCVGMRPAATRLEVELLGRGYLRAPVEVLGESRRLTVQGGVFRDALEAYGVRLFRISP